MRALVLSCAILTACSTLGAPDLPASITDLPGTPAPLDRLVVQARSLQERGLASDAVHLVESVLREDPHHVDGLRLRQDLLRTRGRTGLLRSEVERMLQADPADPVGWYLRGRLVPEPRDKVAAFRQAATLAPRSLWPWVGLAFVLRESEPERALAIYGGLYGATEGHPIVAIAYAQTLRQQGRHQEAISVYERLRGHPDAPGIGDLGLAQTLLAEQQRAQAWPPFLAALRQRPFDPAVQNMMRDWLRAGLPDEQVEQMGAVLQEDPARLAALARGEGAAVAVQLLQRLQRPQLASTLLQRIAVTARQPALRRLQRRLQLGQGDVSGYLQMLAADAPSHLIDDERNQLRGIWVALLRGPWHAGDPAPSPEQATALLAAMRDAGMLADAQLMGDVLARRWPGVPALEAVRDEVARELAFEAAMRRLLYLGYGQSETPPLGTVLAQLREISQTILGRDVVGRVVTFDLPLVGSMLDPFATGLCLHLARYNKHLVLGQRSGGLVEGLLFVRWALRDLEEDPELAVPARCHEVVGGEREVRSFTGVAGGDLAGVALLNHFVIDYDAVREWSHGIAERRRIAAEDGGALLHDPLPAELAVDEPLDVAWRLALLSPAQDSELDDAVFDTIRRHERQHLVDAFHFLPIESNLWRGLGLLLRFGLSATAVEGEMERRAEVASLALTPHTELALAHVADFLGHEDAESPHAVGFGRLAGQLVDELERRGVARSAALPARWHELDRNLVRAAARALLDEFR